MNQRKPNMSPWYALGLAMILMVSALIMATGVTWARYRTEKEETIKFKARTPVTVYLGEVVTGADGTTTFQQTNGSGWKMVDGQAQLNFAVANGTSAQSFESRDEQVRIRLIGSLGILTGEETATIKLVVPVQEEEIPQETTDPEQTTEPTEATEATEPVVTTMEFVATAVRIAENSPLYTTFGDGWMFCFLNEEGAEITWLLDGGQLSYIDMTVILENGTLTNTSLLQLQVTGELAE